LSTLLRKYKLKDTEEEVLDIDVIYAKQVSNLLLMELLDVVYVDMTCVWNAIKNEEVC